MTIETRDFAVRTTFVVLAILSIVIVSSGVGVIFYDGELAATYSIPLITIGISFWTPSILKLRKGVKKDDIESVLRTMSYTAPLPATKVVRPDPPSDVPPDMESIEEEVVAPEV